jgi:hypothetical protein
MSPARLVLVAVLALAAAGCGAREATVRYAAGDQGAAPLHTLSWSFDAEPTGGPPAAATVFSGTWVVRPEDGAPTPPNAICQTGTAEFPALALADVVLEDVVLQAHFKPISGQSDQAAGLIFRIQDKDDYYILRANALENNLNLYKYAGGQRSTLAEGKAKVESGRWQELRAEVVGDHFRGSLGGKAVVEATDDTFRAGKVGLWTKADSVTCFDDVQAKAP